MSEWRKKCAGGWFEKKKRRMDLKTKKLRICIPLTKYPTPQWCLSSWRYGGRGLTTTADSSLFLTLFVCGGGYGRGGDFFFEARSFGCLVVLWSRTCMWQYWAISPLVTNSHLMVMFWRAFKERKKKVRQMLLFKGSMSSHDPHSSHGCGSHCQENPTNRWWFLPSLLLVWSLAVTISRERDLPNTVLS